MPGVREQFFERQKALATAEPDAEAQARLSGPQSTQASGRVSACAHNACSPGSSEVNSGSRVLAANSRTIAAARSLLPTLWTAFSEPMSAAWSICCSCRRR